MRCDQPRYGGDRPLVHLDGCRNRARYAVLRVRPENALGALEAYACGVCRRALEGSIQLRGGVKFEQLEVAA